MIILRNKNYSTLYTKALRKLSGVKSRIGRYIQDTKNHNKYMMGKTNTFQPMTPKTNIQLGRKAIQTRENINNKIVTNISRGKTALEEVASNPGGVVNKSIEATIKNPVAVTGQVTGKALMVAPVDPVIKAAPIGGVTLAAEGALKRYIPSYRRATENGAARFRNSKLKNKIESGTNTIYRLSQNLTF